jgi:hypothetical protein
MIADEARQEAGLDARSGDAGRLMDLNREYRRDPLHGGRSGMSPQPTFRRSTLASGQCPLLYRGQGQGRCDHVM